MKHVLLLATLVSLAAPAAALGLPEVYCSQSVAVRGAAVECEVDGTPVYAGAGCGQACTGIVVLECAQAFGDVVPAFFQASCSLPYVFCPHGPICPGPMLA